MTDIYLNGVKVEKAEYEEFINVLYLHLTLEGGSTKSIRLKEV